MINITKISNEETGFLINYYTETGNKILIVNEENIVPELNKAFQDIIARAALRIATDREAMANGAAGLQKASGALGGPILGSYSECEVIRRA